MKFPCKLAHVNERGDEDLGDIFVDSDEVLIVARESSPSATFAKVELKNGRTLNVKGHAKSVVRRLQEARSGTIAEDLGV